MSRVFVGHDFWRRRNDHVDEPIYWDSTQVTSPHIGIAGASGAGKTHFIREFVDNLAEDIQVDIFDYHGDIEVPGAETVLFSESTRYGFNPLVLNPDPHFGGVRRAINDLISALNATSSQLGTNQQGVLRNLLQETYALRGILPDNPATWVRSVASEAQTKALIEAQDWTRLREVYPTLADVLTLARRKLKALWMGVEDKEDGRQALSAFDDFCKTMSAVTKARQQLVQAENKPDIDPQSLETRLLSAKTKAHNQFGVFLNKMQNGREFEEAVKYNSKDVLLSVINRLELLQAIGIFSGAKPPFGNARIRRYNLKPLGQSPDELRMFVHYRLRAINREEMQRGESPSARRLVVIDECKHYCDDNPQNPVNITATEMRKFGLGLLLAGQSPSHMSQDFIDNAGMLLLLNLSPTYWDVAARKLKIDPKQLRYLQPHKTGAVRLTEKGQIPAFRQVSFV